MAGTYQVILGIGAMGTILGLALFLERNYPNAANSLGYEIGEVCCSTVAFLTSAWAYVYSQELFPHSLDARQSINTWLIITSGLMIAALFLVRDWVREWGETSGW